MMEHGCATALMQVNDRLWTPERAPLLYSGTELAHCNAMGESRTPQGSPAASVFDGFHDYIEKIKRRSVAFARRLHVGGDDMRPRIAVLATLLGLAVVDLAAAPASAGQLPSINELRSYSIRRLQDCGLLNEIRVAYSARDIRMEHWPKAKAIIPWYSANCTNG